MTSPSFPTATQEICSVIRGHSSASVRTETDVAASPDAEDLILVARETVLGCVINEVPDDGAEVS